MYFIEQKGASRPSDSPISNCRENSDFCHAFHGAATAGAVVGQPVTRYEANERLGAVGAAVGAHVFQIKIGGGDSATGQVGWPHESLVDALYWIDSVLSERPENQGKIASVNLSASGASLLEGAVCGPEGLAVDAVAARLTKKGIAVVMSAGNHGVRGSGSWNCGTNIIRVGATNVSAPNTLWLLSNRGHDVQLYAPVGDATRANHNALLLPWKSSGTFYAAGTSFASPQVAGAFAVLRQKFGSTPTVAQLTALLHRTGTSVTGMGAPVGAVSIDIGTALNGTP
jgi:serine protease